MDARPYHLMINFRANTVIKDTLRPVVKVVDAEFGVLSRSFSRNHPPGSPEASKVFFVHVNFEEEGGKEAFNVAGATAVPAMLALRGDIYVRPPDKSGSAIPASDFIPKGGAILQAEMQGVFLSEKLGIQPGPMFRPTFKDSPLFMPALAASALLLLWLVGSFFYLGWYRSEAIYLAGALGIFWFSSGGYMFTIIRSMPFVLNQSIMHKGRGQQTGGEALLIGGLYLVATAGFAALVYVLPKIKVSQKQKTRYAYAALGTSAVACMAVFYLAGWKENYSILAAFFRYSSFDLLP